jgi:hypothetical protein
MLIPLPLPSEVVPFTLYPSTQHPDPIDYTGWRPTGNRNKKQGRIAIQLSGRISRHSLFKGGLNLEMQTHPIKVIIPAPAGDQPSCRIKPLSIVAVHGVGDAIPGEIMVHLAKPRICDQRENPAETTSAAFVREDLVLDGIVYPRLRNERQTGEADRIDEIIEMHWSDVLRPPSSAIGVLQHLLYVPLAMVLFSCSSCKTADRRYPIARLHIQLFGATYLWIFFGALMVMFLASCGTLRDDAFRWVLAVVVPLAMVVVSRFLGRYHGSFRFGYIFALVALVAGMITNMYPGVEYRMIASSGLLYGWMQTVLSATFLMAMIEAILIRHGLTATQRLARAAFVWLPFLIFCGIVSVSWAISLQLAESLLNPEAFRYWSNTFLRQLPFSLRAAELALMSATLAIILIPVGLGLIAYFVPGSLRRNLGLPQPGRAAQDVVAFALWFGPAAIIVAYCVIRVFGSASDAKDDIINIYQLSALRVFALIPLLIPAIRVLLDVIGDVVFHILPAKSAGGRVSESRAPELSSKSETIPRLRTLLNHIRKSRPNNEVLVLAHSQGTVIAYSVLNTEPRLADRFVTLGSPIESLYKRFVSKELEARDLDKAVRWDNLYRSGDYIGGEIREAAKNKDIGSGGHTRYWNDSRVLVFLQSL